MGTLFNLQYTSADGVSVFNIKDLNSSFASGSLKVMYIGQNRNGSFISKDSVMAALPSLKNVPIVCHYDCESNEIGGHDIEVVRTSDGGMKLRNLTTPIGVVPETATYKFEIMDDPEGVEREYLIINGVILWKRQEAYSHIANDLEGKVGHSMEISIKDGKTNKNTGLYEIKDFEFTALCLLENVTPCFQGSELELFSASEFKHQMENMMAELKDSLLQVNPSETQRLDIHPQNNLEEGGKKVLDELEVKMALVEEYGVNIDELDFAINDFTVEELRAKFEELKAIVSESAPEESAEEYGKCQTEEDDEEDKYADCKKDDEEEDKYAGCGKDDEDKKKYSEEQFELNQNIEEEVRRAVVMLGEKEMPWGKEPRYWMVDFDSEKSLVYVEDCCERKLYSMIYSVDGDAVVIDINSMKRMKWAIVEFVEGDKVLPFAQDVEVLEAKCAELMENESIWSDKYQSASDTISSLNAENEELRQYKMSIENAVAQSERESVFEMFEDLTGVEAFEELRESAMNYSLDALEEKCFAIRGRVGSQAKFSLEPKAPKIKVAAIEDPKYAPYGGIVEYYQGKK